MQFNCLFVNWIQQLGCFVCGGLEYLEHLKTEHTKCWRWGRYSLQYFCHCRSAEKTFRWKKSFSWQLYCTVTGLGERNWHLKDFLCKHVKSRDKEDDRCPSALHSAAALKDMLLLWIQQIWVSALANNGTVSWKKYPFAPQPNYFPSRTVDSTSGEVVKNNAAFEVL